MDWQNKFSPLSLSTTDALPELALSHLTSWGAINMIGDDKKSYLSGQVTCDVVSLKEGDSTLGAHCDAKGKVWSVFRLFHHNDGYAMFQPKSAIAVELAEIKKYAIFSKVNILESEDVALGLIGSTATQFIDQLSDSTEDVRHISGGTAVKIDELRWLLLVNAASAAQLVEKFEAQLIDESLWTRLDIEAGLPVLTAHQQNEHIPQAFNLQALDGISFTKGCYTGQETVARAKYRGMNKRAMFIVSGQSNQNPGANAELERAVGDNWRGAGKLLTSYQFSDNKTIGLVVLPNNLESETQLRLKDAPDSLWKIEPLPYSLDDE